MFKVSEYSTRNNMILKSCLILIALIAGQRGTLADDSNDDNILGVNVLGLKAGLNTNLFDKDGPIANVVGDLQTLKKKSDNFWNQVGQNTANFFNKVGSALEGSSNDGSSVGGSVSVAGDAQSSSSGDEQSSAKTKSRKKDAAKLKLSLKGKSTGSWKGSANEGSSSSEDSSISGNSFSSGSSSSSGGDSVSAKFTLPTIHLGGKSWNIEDQGSSNYKLPNFSENTDAEKLKLSLEGKSAGSWKGSENVGSSSPEGSSISGSSFNSGNSFSSGSSPSSGGGSVPAKFTLPTIHLDGQSWNIEDQGSSNYKLPNLSENSDAEKLKLSLEGKSTGSWKGSANGGSSSSEGSSISGSSFNSGNSFSSGSSSSSGGDWVPAKFTLPTIHLGGQSWNTEDQGSSNSKLPNLSENTRVRVSGSRTIKLPTIIINGASTGSGSDKSSGGSSTWTLTEGSGSVPGGSTHGGSSTHESSEWGLNGGDSETISSGSSVNDGSTIWTWGGGSSGSASGRSVNGGSTSGDTSKWSLSGGNSNQAGGQVSKAGNNKNSNLKIAGGSGSSQVSSSGKADSSGSSSGNLVGVNVLGLKAGLCTNLFDANGPLAKAGENLKNILEGKPITNLDDLNNILGVNVGDMKADLTTNLFGSGKASNADSEEEILGKNVLGLHEGLNTNILSKGGPLAKIGEDLKNLLEGKLSLGDLASGKGSAASSNNNVVGVNALGIKLAVCTNLFDKNGPLAKAGMDIDSFFKHLGENNAKILASLRSTFGNGSA